MEKLRVEELSGIRFERAIVKEICFIDALDSDHGDPANRELNVALDLTSRVSDDGTNCLTTISLALESVSGNFVELKAKIEGHFKLDRPDPSVNLEEFSQKQAPAILMPFLRAEVAAATSRSRFGQILIPPINVIAMLERTGEVVNETQ